MAFERTWPAVTPVLFTGDGSVFGILTVSSTFGFKVKQTAVLQSSTQPPTQVQVNRVLSSTQMIVGRIGKPISDRFNASAFTVADNTFVIAEEQGKSEVPVNDQYHAVYEQEPTVAWRSVLVDELGRFYRTDNPIPVRLTDGSVNIGTVNANVDVQLTDKESSLGANDYDITRIGDGVDELGINPDQSINVNIVQSGNINLDGLSYQYNEVLAVPPGVETTILTVSGGPPQKRLSKVDVSGANVAEFYIKVNGVTLAKKRIWHTDFNATFSFEQFINGLKLTTGQILTITALHNRPDAGNFNATAWFV